ncbi:MAG: DNA adenine methylase [Alphaproteobacteria bacterium]|nr:DNA adenine methylase [Alphaproteobacteria bacterium]MDA7988389.1 DNA adenine methylase [Alphaproteobacteria bacterium]MDA8009557.1 DNA adenine methylase [Alphaproteobacteria bacterium]
MRLNAAASCDVAEIPARGAEFHSPRGAVPPLLKWTGSKRSQAAQIAALAPAYNRYFEPFLGGGALLYLLGRPGSVGGDSYAPLMDFWTMVRDDPESLIEDYRRQWKSLQADFPDYFYLVRDRFNREQRPQDLNFLMRTCVNGIARFSRIAQWIRSRGKKNRVALLP